MFDDLRSRSSSPFEDDNLDEDNAPEEAARPKRKKAAKSSEKLILGLTASQRLVLSIMLFLNVAVLGCFLLLAVGVVVPKF